MGMMKNLHIDWLNEQDEKDKSRRATKRDKGIFRTLTGGELTEPVSDKKAKEKDTSND